MPQILRYRKLLALCVALWIPCAWAETPVFAQATIAVAQQRLRVQLADSDVTRERGLMFRETLAPYDGMLFVFDSPRVIRMWMKNTPLALDMVFFDAKRHIVSIRHNTVPYSEAIISSGERAAYVLEVAAGIAKTHGWVVGDKLEWSK